MTHKTNIVFKEKCNDCKGVKFKKTPLGEDFNCNTCKGKGYILKEGTLLKKDPSWDDYALIQTNNGKKKWLFEDEFSLQTQETIKNLKRLNTKSD